MGVYAISLRVFAIMLGIFTSRTLHVYSQLLSFSNLSNKSRIHTSISLVIVYAILITLTMVYQIFCLWLGSQVKLRIKLGKYMGFIYKYVNLVNEGKISMIKSSIGVIVSSWTSEVEEQFLM